MTAISKEFLVQVLTEADEAATKASNEWLANAKPRYAVYSADLITGKPNGGPIDYMLDVCGYARVVVKDKRSAFFKALVKFGFMDSRKYTPTIDLNYPLRCRQEMGLHESAVKAAMEVFKKYELNDKLRVWAYID